MPTSGNVHLPCYHVQMYTVSDHWSLPLKFELLKVARLFLLQTWPGNEARAESVSMTVAVALLHSLWCSILSGNVLILQIPAFRTTPRQYVNSFYISISQCTLLGCNCRCGGYSSYYNSLCHPLLYASWHLPVNYISEYGKHSNTYMYHAFTRPMVLKKFQAQCRYAKVVFATWATSMVVLSPNLFGH